MSLAPAAFPARRSRLTSCAEADVVASYRRAPCPRGWRKCLARSRGKSTGLRWNRPRRGDIGGGPHISDDRVENAWRDRTVLGQSGEIQYRVARTAVSVAVRACLGRRRHAGRALLPHRQSGRSPDRRTARRRNGFSGIWTSKIYDEFRESRLKGKLPDVCRSCYFGNGRGGDTTTAE